MSGARRRTLQVLAVWFGAALPACSGDSAPATNAVPGAELSGPIFGDETAGAAASGYFAGQACAESTAAPQAAAASLLFVVDTSGSMNEAAPGGRGSKWDATRRALLDAIAGMSSETSLGVLFYPNRPALGGFGGASLANLFGGLGLGASCFAPRMSVDIEALGAPGSLQRRRIERAFEQQRPEGGTPTHDAYRFAISQLQATAETGPRFIVLITDGVPTFALGCAGTGSQDDPVDPTPLIGEAAAALMSEVGSFVIGSPGSEGAAASLSRVAQAGGTAPGGCSPGGPSYCHLDLTRELDLGAGLDSALQLVSTQASDCAFELPEPAAGAVLDPERVNVLYAAQGAPPQLISRNANGSCGEGWRYTDDESQIRLCPSTCERVHAAQGLVTLQFGCISEIH